MDRRPVHLACAITLLGCVESHAPIDPCARLEVTEPIELPGLPRDGKGFVRSGDHLFFTWSGDYDGHEYRSWLTILDRAGAVVTTREIPTALLDIVPVPEGVVLVWVGWRCRTGVTLVPPVLGDDCAGITVDRDDPGPGVFWTVAIDAQGRELSAPTRLGADPLDDRIFTRASFDGTSLVFLSTNAPSTYFTVMYVLDERGRPPEGLVAIDRTGRPAAPHVEVTDSVTEVAVYGVVGHAGRWFVVYRPLPLIPESFWLGELDLDGSIRPLADPELGDDRYVDFASGPGGLAVSSCPFPGGGVWLLRDDGSIAHSTRTCGAAVEWLGRGHLLRVQAHRSGGSGAGVELYDSELVLIDEVTLGYEFSRHLAAFDDEVAILEERPGGELGTAQVRFARCSAE